MTVCIFLPTESRFPLLTTLLEKGYMNTLDKIIIREMIKWRVNRSISWFKDEITDLHIQVETLREEVKELKELLMEQTSSNK